MLRTRARRKSVVGEVWPAPGGWLNAGRVGALWAGIGCDVGTREWGKRRELGALRAWSLLPGLGGPFVLLILWGRTWGGAHMQKSSSSVSGQARPSTELRRADRQQGQEHVVVARLALENNVCCRGHEACGHKERK